MTREVRVVVSPGKIEWDGLGSPNIYPYHNASYVAFGQRIPWKTQWFDNVKPGPGWHWLGTGMMPWQMKPDPEVAAAQAKAAQEKQAAAQAAYAEMIAKAQAKVEAAKAAKAAAAPAQQDAAASAPLQEYAFNTSVNILNGDDTKFIFGGQTYVLKFLKEWYTNHKEHMDTSGCVSYPCGAVKAAIAQGLI